MVAFRYCGEVNLTRYMRKIFITILFALFACTTIAQNSRTVRGYVFGSEGEPIVGAKITTLHEASTTTSTTGGAFEMAVTPYAKIIEVSYEGYFKAQAEIDGSSLIIRLKVDKKYAENKAKAEAERKAVEEAVRVAAERAAAAKAAAEERARIVAQREAAEKAKAEEERRIAEAKAEEERRLAAQKEAERAEKARLAKIAAEERKVAYAEQQKGFESMVDLTYFVGLGKQYPHLGVTYTAGYRLNNLLYVGGGAGVDYNIGAKAVTTQYGDGALRPFVVSVPIYAYFRANFLNRRCSPFFALAAGGRVSGKQTMHLDLLDAEYNTSSLFVNPQLGVNFRTTTSSSIYCAVGFNGFSTPYCVKFTEYNATIKYKFGYGIDIHIGVTF